jgi:hypothetical protein
VLHYSGAPQCYDASAVLLLAAAAIAHHLAAQNSAGSSSTGAKSALVLCLAPTSYHQECTPECGCCCLQLALLCANCCAGFFLSDCLE